MRYILILMFVLFFSCASQKKYPSSSTQFSIVGRWCLITNQVNYPTLIFKKDSLATFTSLGDTAYFFKYYVRDKNLHLINTIGQIENTILSLTSDSLVFEHLLEHNNKQTYYRCKEN